jgi:thiamine kinase-like enzyme
MIEEQPDGTVRLWLERIDDDIASPWTLEHYERAAFTLGRFNGSYLSGKPLPDHDWLCRNWSWVSECMKYVDRTYLEPKTWRNSYLSSATLADTMERFETLLYRRELLIPGLERLPRVFCHNDAWQPNLFLSRAPAGKMVIIDWTFCGIAGVGEELGRYFGLTLHSNEMMRPDALSLMETLFQNYLDGLNHAGWHGDSKLVRFGFTASAALRSVMVVPRLVNL